MNTCSLLVLAGLACAQAGSVKILQDSRVGSTRNMVLVGPMSVQDLVDYVFATLGNPDIKMGRLLLYSTEGASRARFRQTHTTCTPQTLKGFLESYGLPSDPPRCPEVSEAIKIGASIVLRTVGPDCSSKARVLTGNADPRVMKAGGEQHEILALWIGVAARSREAWGREYPSVAAFVQTRAELNISLAKEILVNIGRISGAYDVTLVVRNDSNFGEYCKFPSPFLFAEAASLPQSATVPQPAPGEVTCVRLHPYPARCWKKN